MLESKLELTKLYVNGNKKKTLAGMEILLQFPGKEWEAGGERDRFDAEKWATTTFVMMWERARDNKYYIQIVRIGRIVWV